jgi:transcriptional regulator with XRE-family HTH domain
MPDKNIEKAKKLFLEKGLTYAAIATKLGVSSRTVERWSNKGDWKSLRAAEELASVALAEEVSSELAKPIPAKSVRVAMKGLDRNEIFEMAIASLHEKAPEAVIKSQEAAYGQLVKIMIAQQQMEQSDRMADIEVELKQLQLEKERYDVEIKRRQAHPPDMAALFDMVIALGIDPAEFVRQTRAYFEQLE